MTDRISVRGFRSDSSSTSIFFLLPTGGVAGDLVILAVSTAGNAPTMPAGWTLQTSVLTGTPGAAGCVGIYVYTRVIVAGDSASLTITGTTSYVAVNAITLIGANATFIDATPTTNTTSPASQTYTLTGLTTATDDAWIVGFIGCDIDSTTNSITAALTNGTVVDETLRGGVSTSTGVGGQLFTVTGRMATAGVTGDLTRTESTTASISVSTTLAIRPAASTTIKVNQSTSRVVRTVDPPTLKVNQATVRVVRTVAEGIPASQNRPQMVICM